MEIETTLVYAITQQLSFKTEKKCTAQCTQISLFANKPGPIPGIRGTSCPVVTTTFWNFAHVNIFLCKINFFFFQRNHCNGLNL